MQTYKLDIRDRRQVTFPQELLALWQVGVGDSLEIDIQEKKAYIKPQKQIALDALSELQRVFTISKVSQKQLQESINKQRLQKANDQT